MSKIKSISVTNLKAVSSLSADFNGCTAIITGGNNKGKTSFLRALTDRIRGIKPDAVLKQGETEGCAELSLTTGEKFKWQFDGKKEKLTYISERNIPGSVTRELATVYFPKVFDVDEFLNSTPSKQRATLQKLTGIDFTEIDHMYKSAYEERTFRNKALAEEKAKAIKMEPNVPTEEIPTAELEQQLYSIDAHNQKYSYEYQKVVTWQHELATNNTEIDRLMELIEKLGERNSVLQTDINAGKTWLAIPDNYKKSDDHKTALQQKIAAIKETNELVKANKLALEHQKKIETAEVAAKEADEEVKRIEAEKLEVIKNSTMPEGFGFSEDGITYNGFEFNKQQLSSSGIYIAALKLAALTLGEVKTLHFDASYLDKNSLADIEAWANENDFQLLIERPDFDGGEIEYHIIQNN